MYYSCVYKISTRDCFKMVHSPSWVPPQVENQCFKCGQNSIAVYVRNQVGWKNWIIDSISRPVAKIVEALECILNWNETKSASRAKTFISSIRNIKSSSLWSVNIYLYLLFCILFFPVHIPFFGMKVHSIDFLFLFCFSFVPHQLFFIF